MTLFTGGADTTAHLICMTLYYLSTNKEIQETLRKELIPLNIDNPKSVKETGECKYLEAVFNQTFRYYGYMTSVFPRSSLKDQMIGDLPVKKGAIVTAGWIQNNFSEKIFGKDVYSFKPERWLNG